MTARTRSSSTSSATSARAARSPSREAPRRRRDQRPAATVITATTAVVATRDHHIDPGRHFAAAPDFVDSWPAHCVVGTGGERVP